MTFDLAVWEGTRPQTDEAASLVYGQLMDRMEAGDCDTEPTPRIRAYVDALLSRWPEITDESGADSPWADAPLIGNAFGDAIYFAMVWSRADEAAEFAARLADQHGLVCYDPQSERLLPRAHGDRAQLRRSWFRRSL
jgi:hypothetical protein